MAFTLIAVLFLFRFDGYFPQEPTMVQEARAAKRRPTNRAGVITTGEKEMMVVLRDTSKTGACVRVVGSGQLPDTFRLSSPMEKIDAHCTVVWRRGRDCGVKFV